MVRGSEVVHYTRIKVYSILGRFAHWSTVTQQRFRLEKYIRSIQHNVNILIFYLFVSVRFIGWFCVCVVGEKCGWLAMMAQRQPLKRTNKPESYHFFLCILAAMDVRLLRRHRHHRHHRWFRLPISCARIWNCRFVSHSQHLHKIYKNIHTTNATLSGSPFFNRTGKFVHDCVCVCAVWEWMNTRRRS